MRTLAALVLLLWATAALAAGPGDKRRQANAALLAGDTDAALALVEEGLSLAPRDQELLLLRGHVLLRISDYAGALASYRAYLAAGASGGNRRAVERIVANLNNITSTFLRVVVTNGPAQVFVDARSGKPFCVADPECRKGVVPGDHLILLERPGFARATQRVTIEANTTVTVEKTLVERPAPLALRLEPGDAVATVDGQPLGARTELAPGRHVIVAARPGYVSETRAVTASAGQKIELAIALARGVPITVDPADAALDVDGAPAVVRDGLLALPPGTGPHVVQARAPGHRDASATVPADPPPDFKLALALAPLGAQLMVAGAPDGAALFVDGSVRGTVPLRAPVPLEPGHHTVEVVAPGFLPFRASADVSAGRSATVQIDELRRPHHTKAWIATGVAGAGIASGAIFGLLALGKMSDFDDMAPRAGVTHADPALRSLADDGKRFAVVADVSFAVGLAAFATSLYFWRSEGNGTSSGSIDVGPGGMTVSGRF